MEFKKLSTAGKMREINAQLVKAVELARQLRIACAARKAQAEELCSLPFDDKPFEYVPNGVHHRRAGMCYSWNPMTERTPAALDRIEECIDATTKENCYGVSFILS